ncbi:hypothetical protein GGX14DRAFT_420857, partial [Mycena pura]
MLSLPPPTEHNVVVEAQTRLRAKPRFARFWPRKRRAAQPQNVSIAALPLAGPDPLVDVDLLPSASTSLTDSDEQDKYRWAVVYENQRGLKILSTPYYSFFSLLPTDPSPFTIPNSPSKRSDVALDRFPLPDGSWRWLSPWMVDMRSDSGEVQHDGFEYNFMFRTQHWHPEAGLLSWVRRRRWLRLMIRPAKRKDPKNLAESPNPDTPVTSADSIANGVARQRLSVASSIQPSVLESNPDNESLFEDYLKQAWLSEDPEENWEIYRGARKRVGTDGRLLELWCQWLAYEHPHGKGKRKQWTEDGDPFLLDVPTPPIPNERSPPPPIENILPALRSRGEAILQSFIYPESRKRFIQMLESVGLLAELNAHSGGVSPHDVEFWSYLDDGNNKAIPDESTMKKI